MEAGWNKRQVLGALVGVAVVAVPFLNKPFHIDDPVVLNVAAQILRDPGRPFNAEMNWFGNPEPLFKVTTNPPLVSYFLAPLIALFGYSEIALHGGMTLFLFLLAGALVMLSQRFARGAVWPLVFVLFSPATVVSPNVMRDVPLAALSALAVALFIRGADRGQGRWLLTGSMLAGLAVLTKYSALILLPVLASYVILKRRWRLLLWLLPMLAVVGLWCGQNQLVQGPVHLASLMQERGAEGGRWGLPWQDKFYAGLVTLGATLFLFPGLLIDSAQRNRGWLLAGAVVVAALIPLGVQLHLRERAHWQYFLEASLGGVLAYGAVARVGKEGLMGGWRGGDEEATDGLFLVLWFGAIFLASVVYVPFQAVRHIIPALAPLTLLLIREGDDLGGKPSRLLAGTLGVSVVIQAALAFLIGAADYEYADTYRQFAAEARAELPDPGHEIWFMGNWGWHHYGHAAGFTQLAQRGRVPKPGDLLIIPERVHKGPFPPGFPDRLEQIAEKTYPACLPVHTMNGFAGACFYAVVGANVPYLFRRGDKLETFRVYRVLPPPAGPDEAG